MRHDIFPKPLCVWASFHEREERAGAEAEGAQGGEQKSHPPQNPGEWARGKIGREKKRERRGKIGKRGERAASKRGGGTRGRGGAKEGRVAEGDAQEVPGRGQKRRDGEREGERGEANVTTTKTSDI